jgi:hypothetical protein
MSAKRVDANQKEIVAALRKVGASVAHTHMVGQGFPDLVCGYRGQDWLFEIKDGSKPPSARKLTPAEHKFNLDWRGGQIHIVTSVDDALRVIGAAEYRT